MFGPADQAVHQHEFAHRPCASARSAAEHAAIVVQQGDMRGEIALPTHRDSPARFMRSPSSRCIAANNARTWSPRSTQGWLRVRPAKLPARSNTTSNADEAIRAAALIASATMSCRNST